MRYSKRKRRKSRRTAMTAAVFATILIVFVLFIASCGADKQSSAISSSADMTLESETEVVIENADEPELVSLGEFTVTAYCPCAICCGEWSAEYPTRVGTGYIQKTASGTIPKEGRTISVDPDVIPYGAVVVVFGHEYIAEDSGAAVNGNTVDIYFDSHDEALEFGRQTAEVFILSSN